MTAEIPAVSCPSYGGTSASASATISWPIPMRLEQRAEILLAVVRSILTARDWL